MKNEQTERLRAAIEYTRLGFAVTAREARLLARSAAELRVAGICLPSALLPAARSALGPAGEYAPDVVTVVNFPHGTLPGRALLAETRFAIDHGADHIDMVVPSAAAASRDWSSVRNLVRAVRLEAESRAGRRVPIKVILETAAFSEDVIRGAAGAALEAGASWLKTSTGYHPDGGASVSAVRLLRTLAPKSVGVKASGGIRDRQTALAMLDAGADRIGTSAAPAIISAADVASGRGSAEHQY